VQQGRAESASAFRPTALLDEPLEGLAPVIVDELCAAMERMVHQEWQSMIRLSGMSNRH
jgi:ABC-type branched-subunit amino acid transport system ATPase component